MSKIISKIISKINKIINLFLKLIFFHLIFGIPARITISFFYQVKSFFVNLFFLRKNCKAKYISKNFYKSKKFAIYAIYCPDKIYQNIFSTANILRDNGYEVIFVSCGKIKKIELFEKNDFTLLERHKFGMDFISYKYGFKFVNDQKIQPNKILFLNDSVFYLPNFKYHFGYIDNLGNNCIYLNEVHKTHHHFSSFFFIFDKSIFMNQKIKDFFYSIKIDFNRRSFIRHTEILLSSLVKSLTDDIKVYYKTHDLVNKYIPEVNNNNLSSYLEKIEKLHPVHYFNLSGIVSSQIFYLKKDLLYKNIENYKNLFFSLKSNNFHNNEILSYFKFRGKYSNNFFQNILKNLGYK